MFPELASQLLINMRNPQNKDWLPPWLRWERTEPLCFKNGIQAVEFVNQLLDWIDSTKLGDKRKIKYKHFVTFYAVGALEKNRRDCNFKTFWTYVVWVSKKVKTPLPDEVRNKIVAYSL